MSSSNENLRDEPKAESSGCQMKRKREDGDDQFQKPSEIVCDEEGGEHVMTMMDVLEAEKELEDNVNAVLGGSDEKDCTYLRGPVARQALYACNTCRPPNGEPNGICLACSYACHEGHDLYELYTKRSFQCDCGNSRMISGAKCNLCPNKRSANSENHYNHNFSGLYCTCNRPYPDPENNDEMYQCIACEDWFHGKHLETEIPEEFGEMICHLCMDKLDFLWYYHKKSSDMSSQEENISNAISNIISPMNTTLTPIKEEKSEVLLSASLTSSVSSGSSLSQQSLPSTSTANEIEDIETKSTISSIDANIDSGIESSCDSIVAATSADCKFKALTSSINIDGLKGASFWEEGWRSTLCKCTTCLHKYLTLGVSFICDEKDTVQFYEKQGKEKSIQISQYERGLNEINKMDRVKTIEAIQECNFMTGELKTYLKKFVDSKKVVRPEDIQEFFEGLKARKRSRIEESYSY